MNKTLRSVERLSHVAFVDDERADGNGIIVTLADGYDFAADPGCGVRGFDTPAEVKAGCGRRSVIAKVQPTTSYTRTPQQEQELEVMRSRGEI